MILLERLRFLFICNIFQSCLLVKTLSFINSPENGYKTNYRCQSHCSDLFKNYAIDNRRNFFNTLLHKGISSMGITVAGSNFVAPSMASATTSTPGSETKTKPFAANEALLPSVRVKVTIDQAVSLTKDFQIARNERSESLNDNDEKSKITILDQLNDLLLKPQNYLRSYEIQGVPSKPANLYTESYKAMSGDLPFQRFFVKNGDISAWKNLKKKEKEEERKDEIRAAFNAYTDNLSFSSDSYLLNVDKATRSSMVREDSLPEVKQVITSDMGMRYLYRNQVLTAMDNARSELTYIINHPSDVSNGEDLLEYLQNAQGACERWLSLIDENQLRTAIETVKSEL